MAWERILSDFVPISDLLGEDGLIMLFPKSRRKILKRALVVQPVLSCRRNFWLQYCGRVHQLAATLFPMLPVPTSQIYAHFVETSQQLSPESISEIQRDVNRTLPGHSAFSSQTALGQSNREKLSRILLAVSAAETDVGYCQGMNFVVATLLVNLDYSEEDAFWMFLAILNNYHFKHLFSPDVPLLPLRMFHFSRLVRTHLPNVWHHLNAKTFSGVEIFANQWIMTLFAYYLEPEVLGRVWDLFFLLGWKYIFQFGLTILKLLENDLCKMDVEEISAFMSSSRNGNNSNSAVPHPFTDPELVVEQLLYSLNAPFHVTNGQLEALTRQFMNQKLIQVLHELPSDEIIASMPVPDDRSEFSVSRTQTRGFWWVHTPSAPDHPVFLQIDLFALDTPNRPREELITNQPTIWLPTKSLRELKVSMAYVDAVHQKDSNKLAADLELIEKDLVFETHVLSSLQIVAAKAESALKDAAKQKYITSKAVKNSMTFGESADPQLMKKAKAADKIFTERRAERDQMSAQVQRTQNRITTFTSRKNENIRLITKSFSELEDTQNDIISRSIQSAIASFSNKA